MLVLKAFKIASQAIISVLAVDTILADDVVLVAIKKALQAPPQITLIPSHGFYSVELREKFKEAARK